MGIETTPTPTGETKEEAMKAVREELQKGKSSEEIEKRAKEMFGEGSKLVDEKPVKDGEEKKGYTVTHDEDGTINFEYDDEKEEDKE